MCPRAHLRAQLAAQKLHLNRLFLQQPVSSEHGCLSDFVLAAVVAHIVCQNSPCVFRGLRQPNLHGYTCTSHCRGEGVPEIVPTAQIAFAAGYPHSCPSPSSRSPTPACRR